MFQVPDEALPLSIGAITAGAGDAGKGDRVAAVFEQVMGRVDIEIVEEVFVAVAFEMDEAGVFKDGYRLRINGDEGGWEGLKVSDAAIFCSGDAKPWVVWEGLVGIFVPEFHEPLLISGNSVIEADEDGLHIGGDVGSNGCVEEFGAVEKGVQQGEGAFDGGVGGQGVGLVWRGGDAGRQAAEDRGGAWGCVTLPGQEGQQEAACQEVFGQLCQEGGYFGK